MSSRTGIVRAVLHAYATALPPYFVWEMLQMPAYTGMPESWGRSTAWCALAALADAAVAASLVALGAVAYGDTHWYVPPTLSRYARLVAAGMAVHLAAEWVMVRQLGWFGYSPRHPIVPLLDIGALAILQPLVVLPLVFAWLARSQSATKVDRAR